MYCSHCMSKLPEGAQYCEHCHNHPGGKSVPHHLSVGTLLHGRYLIGDAIGEGGFGVTYIGLDINLDMKIAVKEFYPHGYANRNNAVSNDVTLLYSGETEYFNYSKEHFLREAKSIAKFSKEDAIVDVRDYFTENQTAYIVLEYIEGITLSQYIKSRGVFTADEIFRRMAPLMKALQVMHRSDVIHRDISPDNIMITNEGNLKLMDFGSARYFAGDQKRTMSVILKPGYAPFEQYSAEGHQGPWTDVYGLCATIYKCITGMTPPDAMSRCQQDKLQPPSFLGVRISPSQEAAIMRGMSIYPNDRIRSIDELTAVLSSVPRAAVPVRPQPQPRIPEPRPVSQTYDDAYTRYDDSQPAGPPKKSSAVVPIVIALIVSVLVIGGVVGFIIWHSSEGTNNTTSPTTAPTQKATESATEEATEEMTEAPTEESTDGVVIMPDVTGEKYTEAKGKLEGLGLKVEITREYSDTVAKDYVIRQSISENRQLRVGNSVMLYVSSGKAPKATSAPAPTNPPQSNTYDVEAEVQTIRDRYYAIQADPGTETTQGDVTYYTENGHVNKAVCAEGYDSWNYTRSYYYQNGKLFFAFINNGTEEYRLYFKDNVLIRYIDNSGNVTDYGNINCPMESRVLIEACDLID